MPEAPDQLPGDDAPDESDFAGLVMRYLARDLSAAMVASLEQELAADPAKRELFVWLCLTDSLSHELLSQQAQMARGDAELLDSSESRRDPLHMQQTMVLTALSDNADTDQPVMIAPRSAAAGRRDAERRNLRRGGLAAGVLLALGVAAALLRHHQPQPVATLTQMVGATWDDGSSRPTPSAILPGEQLRLKSGFCLLTFADGTQVIAEGPAQFTAESSGQISLSDGNLSATMTHGASGFTIRTPTVTVTDLGTEFGVRFNAAANATDVQVFQGKVRLTADASAGAKPVELPTGASAHIASDGNLAVDPKGAQPQMFVRRLDDSVLSLSVTDLICGGDGTTHRTGTMVNPSTGETGILEPILSSQGDRRYHPIHTISILDGCFIPDQGDIQVDSAGHLFNFTAPGGLTHDLIVAGGVVPSVQGAVNAILDKVDYSAPPHSLLFLHPECGLTFNLDAIRRLHPSTRLDSLHAVIGNSIIDPRGTPLRPGLRVLVDGTLRFDRTFKSHNDVDQLDLPLGYNDHFLTLISMKNTNFLSGQDVLLGDPVFRLSPAN